MMDYIDRNEIEKWMNRDEWDTPDERWRPESEFGRMIDAVPSPWISVREKVPTEWEHVLVVLGIHNIVEVAVYVGGEWKITWNHDKLDEVAYWMPLPELPELDKEVNNG